MKFLTRVVAVVILAGILPGHAAELASPTTAETLVSTTTISASTLIAPGRYSVSVAPNFNSGMDKRLEKALGKVPGLSAIKARPEDSSIHFSVQEGSRLHASDIQKAVKKTDNGAVITVPVLEGSLTNHP